MVFKLFKELYVQIILAIILAIIVASSLSIDTINQIYTASNFVKEALMAFLPIVTFSFMFYSMARFAKSAPLLIGSVLIVLMISNALSFNFGYWTSYLFLNKYVALESINIQTAEVIRPLFSISQYFPSWWEPKNGLIAGLIIGIIFSFVPSHKVFDFATKLKNFSTNVLLNLFIPVLPIFIFGTVLKLQYEGVVYELFANYGKVILFTVISLLSYLFLFVLISQKFNIKKTFIFFKDFGETLITAFTTMSSIAAMPLMLKASKDYIDNEDYANFVIPSTINIHLVGDGIVFGTTIYTLLAIYGMPIPSFHHVMMFTIAYVLSRFSVAGVPAGSTLITAPLAALYFNFNAEMVGIFTTVCILQDTLITLGNVGGNCAFAVITNNLFGGFLKK